MKHIANVGISVPAKKNRCEKKQLETSSNEFHELSRLVEISGLAGYLRNFQISLLTKNERKRFLEFQDFLINLEAKCFDEFGFVR